MIHDGINLKTPEDGDGERERERDQPKDGCVQQGFVESCQVSFLMQHGRYQV